VKPEVRQQNFVRWFDVKSEENLELISLEQLYE